MFIFNRQRAIYHPPPSPIIVLASGIWTQANAHCLSHKLRVFMGQNLAGYNFTEWVRNGIYFVHNYHCSVEGGWQLTRYANRGCQFRIDFASCVLSDLNRWFLVPETDSSDDRSLMTRSLYEPRMPSIEPDAGPVAPVEQHPAPFASQCKRSFRLRPVSYHDTCRFIPSTNLPSLDHLISGPASRASSPRRELPPSSSPSGVSSTFQGLLQPVESPLLGQYGRLKLLKGVDVGRSPIFKSWCNL